jgi:hypothetical protein
MIFAFAVEAFPIWEAGGGKTTPFIEVGAEFPFEGVTTCAAADDDDRDRLEFPSSVNEEVFRADPVNDKPAFTPDSVPKEEIASLEASLTLDCKVPAFVVKPLAMDWPDGEPSVVLGFDFVGVVVPDEGNGCCWLFFVTAIPVSSAVLVVSFSSDIVT